MLKDGSWYWVSPSGEGCVPARWVEYDDPYYFDDPGYFVILGYRGGYSKYKLVVSRIDEDDEITNLETIQFIENTAKLYETLLSLYDVIPKEYKKGIKNKLDEIFDNSKQINSYNIKERFKIPVDYVILTDAPEKSYFWHNGKRYKKSKNCKDYVKIDEKLPNHIRVFVEK